MPPKRLAHVLRVDDRAVGVVARERSRVNLLLEVEAVRLAAYPIGPTLTIFHDQLCDSPFFRGGALWIKGRRPRCGGVLRDTGT